MARVCRKCGESKKIRKDDGFCRGCGSPLPVGEEEGPSGRRSFQYDLYEKNNKGGLGLKKGFSLFPKRQKAPKQPKQKDVPSSTKKGKQR